ncbi:hypothetical protein EES47_08190 [Streptomyces sp. ADI98-12]|uniref:hypothetical protein n=1 Tax=Streptomyces TaxID=1883 RepID=UPI000F54DB0C|nr:hypothetical protein [Streptomyces sp. ADI98-12]RPK90658.1 hypothetical protein EES47_08190 [Streptomyces sp. ADI98-12]
MATAQFSAAFLPASHPRASEGYGKRFPGGQPPTDEADFTGLPAREAAIAAYIDRLPEGAAIGYKALAAALPAYGQQACATALRGISAAGHLRTIREHLTLRDRSMRWVTRTYWSRQPYDDAWWGEFARRIRGVDVTGLRKQGLARVAPAEAAPDVPADPAVGSVPGAHEAEPARSAPPAPPAPEPTAPAADAASAAVATPASAAAPPRRGSAPAPEGSARPVWLAEPDEARPRPRPENPVADRPAAGSTPGYRALARLARTEPRLTLSAAECGALAPLADQWFERGVRLDHFTLALTSGLPQGPIHSPAAFVRSRLEKKMPPLPADTAPGPDDQAGAQPGRVTRVIMVCTTCDQDETTVQLVGGLCPDCRALGDDVPWPDWDDEYRDLGLPAPRPPRADGSEILLGQLAAGLLRRDVPATFLPGPRDAR